MLSYLLSRLRPTPSEELVLIGRLDVHATDAGMAFQKGRGHVIDLGFADSRQGAIADRPPAPDKLPYDNFCLANFFDISGDHRGFGPGVARVREDFVYDGYMRGEIDFTGYRLSLALSPELFARYTKYIGEAPSPDLGDRTSWGGQLMLRMPVRPFAFPSPRGSDDPWSTGSKGVGNLRLIKRFRIRRLEVRKVHDMREGDGVKDELPPPLVIGSD